MSVHLAYRRSKIQCIPGVAAQAEDLRLGCPCIERSSCTSEIVKPAAIFVERHSTEALQAFREGSARTCCSRSCSVSRIDSIRSNAKRASASSWSVSGFAAGACPGAYFEFRRIYGPYRQKMYGIGTPNSAMKPMSAEAQTLPRP